MAMSAERERAGSAPALTRTLAWVVLGLMTAATLYAAWIALANYDRIGV